MFIIEGPDCVGKTTVANKIIEHVNERSRIPAYYQHMTRPSNNFNFGTHYLDMMSKYAVMDRFHLGALAYHPSGTLTKENRTMIEGVLQSFNSVIVIIYAGNDSLYEKKLIKHSKQRKEMFDFEILIAANRIFRNEAQFRYCDFSWDITYEKCEGCEEEYMYPDMHTISSWSEHWIKKLEQQ